MDRYEAYIGKSWQEHGLAQVLVVRRRGNSSADAGFFLVDVWCLGVKDAFADTDLLESELEDYIAERLPEATSEPIHPTCAKKLIEGAVAYAERFGFAPHRDFRKARRVLSGIDAALCPTDFTFGRDGRPCFVRGPHDSEERLERVLAILEARCGEDGYDFVDDSEEDDDILAVREDLIAWLDDEGEEVPKFYHLSGLVTALQICPQPVSPTMLIDAFWGEDGATWSSDAEMQDFLSLLMTYWNYVSELVQAHVEPDASPHDQAIDVWQEDFPGESVVPFAAAMVEWAGGFMRATELWPEAWGDALRRPDLAEHWEVIRWWAEFVGTGNKDRIADAAEGNPPRTIGASVAALIRALRPQPPAGPR